MSKDEKAAIEDLFAVRMCIAEIMHDPDDLWFYLFCCAQTLDRAAMRLGVTVNDGAGFRPDRYYNAQWRAGSWSREFWKGADNVFHLSPEAPSSATSPGSGK